MQIDCPNCEAAYQVPEAALASGRTVRCARCATVWFATLPQEDRHLEPAMAQNGTGSASSFGDDDFVAVDSPMDDHQQAEFDAGARSRGVDAAGESPSLVPDIEGAAGQDELVGETRRDPDEALRAFAARREARRHAVARGSKLLKPTPGLVITAVLVSFAILLMFRVQVVRAMPQTATLFRAIGLPVNLRGVDFEAILTTKEMSDGVPVFIVEGRVVNPGRLPVDVPRLRFAMRNGAGQEIYAWTAQPAKASLNAGESQSFLTRLASPPAEARDVLVRFYTRRDLLNGLR